MSAEILVLAAAWRVDPIHVPALIRLRSLIIRSAAA